MSRPITVNKKVYSGGGGGGGAPRDTDGDGYSDLIEMHMGTDMRDPNDYPGAQPPTPTLTPTPTPTVTPSPTEVPTPTPGPSAKPKRGIPGFEVVFAIAALFAVAYRMWKRTIN